MTQRKPYLLINTTAAVTSEWIQLDYRFDENSIRLANVILTSGDTLRLDLSTYVVENGTTVENIYTETFTVSDSFTFSGPWMKMRGRKEGTNGLGKMIVVG